MLNKIENKVKDVIYLDDIQDKMIKIFREGREPAQTTYIKELDKHFKWLRGDVSIFAGIGNHGKSTFVNQLALFQAMNKGSKIAVFSPENNPPDYFYNDIIHTYLSKPVESNFVNKADESEYLKALDFVKDHIFYIYPEVEMPTQKYINERFQLLIENEGVDFCITDPFNQLIREWHEFSRDDKYIGQYLQLEKRFAQKFKINKITVTHPNSTIKLEEGTGEAQRPTIFNLAGGAMWNNHSDNICFVHRPYKRTQPDNTLVEFTSEKIKKQKIVGVPGLVEFHFNRHTNRFTVVEAEKQAEIREDMPY